MNYSSFKALFQKRFHIPTEPSLRRAVRSFSVAEKALFYIFVFLFIGSALVLLARVNDSFKQQVPIKGGTLTEGVVGNARFINPVLALSESDKDISALVYSGLVHFKTDGSVENDLADKVAISKDGLTYSVHIKDGAKFSDGTAVTADDVVFTIQKIVDPAIKSPIAADWSGVTVSKIDTSNLNFILKKAYAPFIDNLAVGILPKHIWENVTADEFAFSQFNTLPVGSGPYKVSTVERDSGGIPNHFDLVPNNDSSLPTPYLAHIIFSSYASTADLMSAYTSGNIDSAGGLDAEDAALFINNGSKIATSALPRVFGVFFNQSQNKALLDSDVRRALDLAAPKLAIVKQVLGNYGTPIDGPLPPGLVPGLDDTANRTSDADALAQAQILLAKDGWTHNPTTGVLEKKSKSDTVTLSFSLSTGDAPELESAAKLVAAAWQTLGAEVDVKVFATGDLNQNIIRPRHFDALLFGEVLGREADLYPFWHSSERTDPGLNIAEYANSKADRLLETIRTDTDPAKRTADYKNFDQEIRADIPAVFLYAPNYVYAVPSDLQGLTLGSLSGAEDRFQSVRSWYKETDNVWNIFVHQASN